MYFGLVLVKSYEKQGMNVAEKKNKKVAIKCCPASKIPSSVMSTVAVHSAFYSNRQAKAL